ncbi:MspA family porin [Gordonia zhaorongruii]|uniref:MspA family porin n=1 Tax=Gordonia zhaorongruii TaxID=2597659 RepID=UPI0010479022|nr:MspA family porin [Gordonia zhaorongruii]
MTNNSRIATGAAIAGAALIAVTGIPSTTGAADAGKLPGGFKHKNLGDGSSVSIRLFDESVRVSRAVTNIPTSREVWVSGKVAVSTKGDVKGGTLNAGYQVGCQLNFGADAGAEGKAEPDGSGGATGEGTATGGFTLSPGEAKFVPVVNVAGADDDVTTFDFGNARGGLAYSQERFGVDGCAGHASARAQVTVQVKTDTFKGNVTMYGKPFSLG